MYEQYDDLVNGTLSPSEVKDRSQALAIECCETPIPFYLGLFITQMFERAPWFTRMWVLQVGLLIVLALMGTH